MMITTAVPVLMLNGKMWKVEALLIADQIFAFLSCFFLLESLLLTACAFYSSFKLVLFCDVNKTTIDFSEIVSNCI